KREDVIPDVLIAAIPFDRESFLAALGMLRQSPIREPEPPYCVVLVLVQDIHDAAGVQRPQAERAHENRHGRARLDRRPGSADARPSELEHAPVADVAGRLCEPAFAAAEPTPMVIDVITRWRTAPR